MSWLGRTRQQFAYLTSKGSALPLEQCAWPRELLYAFPPLPLPHSRQNQPQGDTDSSTLASAAQAGWDISDAKRPALAAASAQGLPLAAGKEQCSTCIHSNCSCGPGSVGLLLGSFRVWLTLSKMPGLPLLGLCMTLSGLIDSPLSECAWYPCGLFKPCIHSVHPREYASEAQAWSLNLRWWVRVPWLSAETQGTASHIGGTVLLGVGGYSLGVYEQVSAAGGGFAYYTHEMACPRSFVQQQVGPHLWHLVDSTCLTCQGSLCRVRSWSPEWNPARPRVNILKKNHDVSQITLLALLGGEKRFSCWIECYPHYL